MKKLIASAPDKEQLTNCINEYYYSKNYIITDDNKIYNTKTDKTLDSVIVKQFRDRWRFEMA